MSEAELFDLLKELESMVEAGCSPFGDKDPVEKAEIRTWSGDLIDLCNPDPKKIKITDIAKALSHINRFTGHFGQYSVAQHSLLVLYLTECAVKKEKTLSKEAAALAGMVALLHDASEAYLNDVAAPLKQLACMSGYRELESKMTDAIWDAVGIDSSACPLTNCEEIYIVEDIVQKADKAAFDIEVAALPVSLNYGGGDGRLLKINRQDTEETMDLYLKAFNHYLETFGRLTWKGKPNQRSPYSTL